MFWNIKKPPLNNQTQNILLWNISQSGIFTFRLFNNRKRLVALLLSFTCQHLNIPLVFLKFYQEENSAMAYTRKCSVYLKCLYEHTKANNYCYKLRQQLLVACLSHFVQFLGSLVPALPVLCSSPLSVPSEFQCRLNPFFHVPITCWVLLLLLFHSWECRVEGLSPSAAGATFDDPCGPFPAPNILKYSEHCHKPGTEGLIFNSIILGLDSGRNNDKELSKLFKASYRSVWIYFGLDCFIVVNAPTMANLGQFYFCRVDSQTL